MIESRTSRRFRSAFSKLPEEVKEDARQAYRRFQENPAHPSLRFKKLAGEEPLYSIRIRHGYRALGVLNGDKIVWFWIGSHSEYDRQP